MIVAMNTRRHAFTGIRNFRDCGGYRARDGRMFRTGMLYRSAHCALATEEDLAALEALGIGTIVDLRRVSERERAPSRRWSGFAGRVIERDGGAEAELAPHLMALKAIGESGISASEAMRNMYRVLPFEPMIVDLTRDFLGHLAEAEAPVLVHCSAGKDRTGLLVALAHHIAGVGREDIAVDYLMSNDGPPHDAETIARVREHYAHEGKPVSEEAAHTVLRVAPDYLAASFAAIETECGSVDAFLSETIGLSERQRAEIVARFTAPA